MKDLIVATNPKSSFAESIKLIKTNITFSSINKSLKVILMTSPESGDGKSFLVANLASAFAQEDKKVLIIDADLRKGRQHKIFGLERENAFGYSNLIISKTLMLRVFHLFQQAQPLQIHLNFSLLNQTKLFWNV